MVNASIRSIAVAVPPAMDQQGMWDGFFARHYAGSAVTTGSAVAQRIWASSGVVTRHGVVDPRVEDVSRWGTGARMERYLAEAMPLGKEAVTAALAGAGIGAEDVGLFGVVSCTGYATPGVDILLARDLGMRPTVQRLVIGHMGCYAAVPGLAAAADAARARSLTAVLLCIELPSLHVQPPTDDVAQIVAHALFSDAAVAIVVTPGSAGLTILDVIAVTDVAHSADMTWDITDLGFRMRLSPRVPDVLAHHVRPAVTSLLAQHGLTISDVAGWAIHPGGPRILDVCRDELGLPESALAGSREVLRDFGNCSSATVLVVLDAVSRGLPVGAPVVALAFGPGLTLYGALLRMT